MSSQAWAAAPDRALNLNLDLATAAATEMAEWSKASNSALAAGGLSVSLIESGKTTSERRRERGRGNKSARRTKPTSQFPAPPTPPSYTRAPDYELQSPKGISHPLPSLTLLQLSSALNSSLSLSLSLPQNCISS